MDKQTKYYYLLLLVFLFQACEKEYSWNFKTVENESIIVDGLLTNELKEQCIKLSKPNLNLNDNLHPLSGAVIYVDDGTNRFEFSESENEFGSYYSQPFQVVIDRTYRLILEFEGDTFYAESEVVGVTAMHNINVSLDDSTDLYRFNYAEPGQPSMTEVFYDWSHNESFCNTYGNCYAQETYYTLDNVDVNAVFSPSHEIIYFPHGTTLIRRKYGFTEEHQQFIRSLLMETDWSGGIFDVQHGNVYTNMSNGALGLFTTCMVTTDTTIVD